MNHAPLTAFEHDSIQVRSQAQANALSESEAGRLALIGQDRRGFCTRGYDSVQLAQYSGIVSLGERVLEVLPKIDKAATHAVSRRAVLRLLEKGSDVPVFAQVDAAQGLLRAPLLDVFISAFFDTVAALVRGGLLRRYVEHEDDLRVMRGGLVARRQFGPLANRPDVVACRFDELTADNGWNRLLKRALRVIRASIASTPLSSRWVELMVAFDEVGDVNATAAAAGSLTFDRQAVRYRAAIEWARRILAFSSPDLRSGRDVSPGLLFDMNRLFQAAVTNELQRAAFEREVRVESESRERALAVVAGSDRDMVRLRPDLLIRRGRELLAIADAKWKQLEADSSGYLQPAPQDVYQMNAYATAFGCRELALIYPWHDGLHRSRETTLELNWGFSTIRPKLTIVCVDIRSDPFIVRRGRSSTCGQLFRSRAAMVDEELVVRTASLSNLAAVTE